MRIGVPKEIKILEGRVGLIPEAAANLVRAGQEVFVETGAGHLSGFSDEAYEQFGIQILPDAGTLYAQSQLIVKVKEPIGEELERLRSDHILFGFLHLAAMPELAAKLQQIGLLAIAFETVEDGGILPILAPMSDIAGRVSAQVGAHLLHQPQGGMGVLLGGLPGVERGNAVVLGGGVAGTSAATMLAGMGANITIFDLQREKLAKLRNIGENITTLYPYQESIQRAVLQADLLIGAVLITGARTPHLVSAGWVEQMKSGSVIVDISVDQGGCIETTEPTTYAQPTYTRYGVVHFGVTNMPGAVPRSASQALSAALTPYVGKIADGTWGQIEALQKGVNVRAGKIVHPSVAKALTSI
jgi:alanine dehydrogenase